MKRKRNIGRSIFKAKQLRLSRLLSPKDDGKHFLQNDDRNISSNDIIHDDGGGVIINNSIVTFDDIARSSTERVQVYRARQMENLNSSQSKSHRKTVAERVREYRQRQTQQIHDAKNQTHNIDENSDISEVSNESDVSLDEDVR